MTDTRSRQFGAGKGEGGGCKRGMTRRYFLQASAMAGGAMMFLPGCCSNSKLSGKTGIRVEKIHLDFEEIQYRTPYKFGGVPVDRATLLNVTCEVSTPDGGTARGFASMSMGNVWAFPSKEMPYQTTLGAMKTLAERLAATTRNCRQHAHPIELHHQLEPEYLKAAVEVSGELKLASPIPKLCTMVVASPIDAALHDAYGKSLGLNCYRTYSREMVGHGLERYLNNDFKEESIQSYCLAKPRAQVSLFHSVGGADPITEGDIAKRLNDGLPETLAEWIRYNGLTHIKIKLQGENLEWDIERTVGIERVARETRPETAWRYCVDFNERCPNVDYVLEYLRKVKERSPRGFDSILYLEQPTARDLKSNRQNDMHAANRFRPVVIDESLTDLESLLLAREMGYTGVALKACKGQSHAMLMAAAAQKYKMFLCVQDLTCPGAAFVHSAGIAAHVPGVSGIEGNARQYMPAANEPWKKRFPGLFNVKDGELRTSTLTGPGLGVVA